VERVVDAMLVDQARAFFIVSQFLMP